MSDPTDRGPRWDPVWMLRMRPVRIVVVLLVLVLIFVFALPSLLEGYARWLIDVDEPTEADVAVVLGGGEGERLGAALRIWRQGRVPAVLITGPATPLLKVYVREDSLSQGEAKRRIAIRKGVPESNVWLALGPTSTYEEAVTVLEELEARGVESAIIVTSPLHSRRASKTFEHIFRESSIRLTLETLPLDLSQDNPERWWTREREVMGVFTETLKLLYYWKQYGIVPV